MTSYSGEEVWHLMTSYSGEEVWLPWPHANVMESFTPHDLMLRWSKVWHPMISYQGEVKCDTPWSHAKLRMLPYIEHHFYINLKIDFFLPWNWI